jgi:hypothetical protein
MALRWNIAEGLESTCNFCLNDKENTMKKGLNIAIVLVMFIVGVFISPAIYTKADGGDISLIHACVKDRGGDVKIVGANSSCPSGYNLLHWGITGPQGPQGLQGPPGPASLPTAYSQTIDSNFTNVGTHSPDFTTIGTFELPAGKWALFVTVSTWLDAANPIFAVSCQIPEVAGMSVTYSPSTSGDGYQEGIDLQIQGISGSSVTTQTLTLQCTASDGWWSGWAIHIQAAALMAIQVAP